MYTLCTISALFLQPLFSLSTPVLSPSDWRNDASVSLPDATDDTANIIRTFNSHPSPISLTIDLFGSQLPSDAVHATFRNALISIYPFLHGQPDNPIIDDTFQSRPAGRSVQIGVTAALRHGITWHELNAVLLEIYGFMNGHSGDLQRHVQELSFEIAKDGTKIGDGLVSYHRPPSLQSRNPTPANHKNTNYKKLLFVHSDPVLNLPTANAIQYRVPHTPFMLAFGFLGDAIPGTEVSAAFRGSQSHILGFLVGQPNSPIPGARYEYIEKGVRITVLAERGTVMTWKQLSWVLGGMYGFMSGSPEHYQLLTCEVSSASQGIVGYASVGFSTRSVDVISKRALLNATAHLPIRDPTSSEVIRFPVPDTPIILAFTYIGVSVPRRQLNAAISAALEQIDPSWRHHGADFVPGNHFYQVLDGVQTRVFANVPYLMSWNQLRTIVWGLFLFVRGVESGEEHYHVLNFDVDDVQTGKLAHGAVRYSSLRNGNAGGGASSSS